MRLAQLFHLAPKRSLDLQILGNGFDNPVAIRDFVEVVIEAAGGDQRGRGVDEERAGALLDGGLDPLLRDFPGQIKQNGGDSRVREVGGDSRAHGAGAEDGNSLDRVHIPQGSLST